MLLKQHTSILAATILVVSTLTSYLNLTSSQEAPYYNLTQFEPIPAGVEVPRQDVCDRLQALQRGEVPLADALRGLDLHPAIAAAEYVILDEEGRLDQDYPGLLPKLLDEISRRAGFRWRNTFGLTWPPEMTEGRTFPDLLEWSVTNFDVCVDWWPNNADNAQRNVALSFPWYDASLILVWDPPEPTKDNGQFLFSFFAPFSWGVWGLTVATLLVSGYVFLIFEKMDAEELSSNNWWKPSFREHVFLSAITFTGNFSYTPQNNPARLFAWSLTFLSLVWSASYTANLASFLVAKNKPPLVINSIEDAIRVGPLCVSDLTNALDHISNVYPTARFVRKDTEVEMFQALRAGECICAATTMVSWLGHRQNIDANPDCKLERIISTVAHLEASFGFQAALGLDKCTPLIRDVFQIHMIRMQEDGFFDKAWKYEFDRTMQIPCDQNAAKTLDTTVIWDDLEEDTYTLGLKDMGGIFVVHYGLTVIALLFGVYGYTRKRKGSVEKKDELPLSKTQKSDDANSVNESDFQDAMSTHSDNFYDNPLPDKRARFPSNDVLNNVNENDDFDETLDNVITYLKELREKQKPSSPLCRRQSWLESKRKNGAKNQSVRRPARNPWHTTRGFGAL